MVGRVGGRVRDYNATSGPNWSAEAELMISWVDQLKPGMAKDKVNNYDSLLNLNSSLNWDEIGWLNMIDES